MHFRLLLSCVAARLVLAGAIALASEEISRPADYDLLKRQGSPATDVLECFQVYEPVLTPAGESNDNGCVHTQTLMEHDFAYSYGMPFVGNYTPPPCEFNRVTMNFTVTSKGRQFDRLAIMYLGDVEVWRTSTAEPTSYGIIFTYIKEMQHYNSLWKEPQKIIFDLGNLVDDTYTGIWHTTLTATFFTVPDSPPTADAILPISKKASAENAASVFSVPDDTASVSYSIPKNVERAVISLSACGQSTEEFWYQNTLSSETETFVDAVGSLYGGSPWREVQILIDGQLAGVSWPFPIIFTGGIVPGFWRPIVGIDAFDLRENEVDITPWLPYLTDGQDHSFEIRVASINDDGAGNPTLVNTTGQYWLVTGKIFLFLGDESYTVSGSLPEVSAPAPELSISSQLSKSSNGTNETLTWTTDAKRSFSVSATVNDKKVSWSQSLEYSNYNELSGQGVTGYSKQSTTGNDRTSSPRYFHSYFYPLSVNSTYLAVPNGPTSINGTLDRGFNLAVLGRPVFPSGVQPFNSSSRSTQLLDVSPLQAPEQISLPASLPHFDGAVLNTTQWGASTYYNSGGPNGSFSTGNTSQIFKFAGTQVGGAGLTSELYSREVDAVNTKLEKDEEVLLGRRVERPSVGGGTGRPGVVGEVSVRAVLGRGPGKAKEELQGGRR